MPPTANSYNKHKTVPLAMRFDWNADCSDLLQVIEPLEDEINILANAIALWMKQPDRSAIAKIIMTQIAAISTERLPGQKKGKVPTSKPSDRLWKKCEEIGEKLGISELTSFTDKGKFANCPPSLRYNWTKLFN